MSNDEATTIELSEDACVEAAAASGIELLMPRQVPLGGPRAMPVLRVLPNKHRHCIGAWCFVDAFGPTDLTGRPGMVVPPHPHTGLQTVSWLVHGAIEHRDSAGGRHTVRPGGVNVMTAGRGIAHSEYSTPDAAVLHGVQLWVALPAAERDREPSFQGFDEVPAVPVAAGAQARVFVGSWAGAVSAAERFSELVGAELRLDAGARAAVPLTSTFEHGVLALTPGIAVDDVPIAPGAIAYLEPGRASAVVSSERDGVAIVLGGVPLDEAIVMFWNFVGGSHDEVAAAREQWMRERGGARATRFGRVVDDDATPLASPRVPDVELLPRGRARRR